MKILVTGAAGFVGSHLCDRLLSQGHVVVGLDNLQTGARSNLSHLDGNRAFSFVRHDVVESFPDLGRGFDRVYNLACPASPPKYQQDLVHTMLTSVLGALHALRFAQSQGARVFQASTSEVYGDPLVHPQVESYLGNVNLNGPRACYDEGKRAAETLFCDFERAHGTPIRIARIFNTYGPRMDKADGRVVSNFIRQALAGEPVTVYGDGSQTRSFCYVSDLIDGFTALMEHPDALGPTNLGNPVEFTMLELVTAVEQVVGKPLQVVHRPLPVDDPKVRRPDIAKAAHHLGFDPKVPLHEGIRHTVADFMNRP